MSTTNKVDWSFIESMEGSSKQGYVPCDGKGNVIGNSGCTIACGFDIGNQTVSAMTSFHFSNELLRKLLPYAEKQGNDAKTFLSKYPLYLSGEEVDEINGKVHARFLTYVSNLFNSNSELKFEELDSKKQTTIMSVAYQYGDLKHKCPSFFRAITNGWWKEAVDELRSFGDKFPTRRGREADLLASSL